MASFFEPLDEDTAAAPATAATWHSPAKLAVSRILRGVCQGCEGDRDIEHCRDFSLSRAQVRTLLARARSINGQEFHHEFDWAPCVVRGVARWDHTEVGFEISAFLVATLRFRDGSVLMLGCDGACEKAVTGTAREPTR